MKTDFKAIIKNAMKSKGISQKQLAEAVGSYQSHISAYLNGKRGFPSEKIEKVFDALGLEIKQTNL